MVAGQFSWDTMVFCLPVFCGCWWEKEYGGLYYYIAGIMGKCHASFESSTLLLMIRLLSKFSLFSIVCPILRRPKSFFFVKSWHDLSKKSLTLKLYFFYSIGLVKLEKGAKTMITSAAWPRITVSSLWNLTTFNYLVVWPTKCLKNNVMINDTKTFFKNKHLEKPSFSLRKKNYFKKLLI